MARGLERYQNRTTPDSDYPNGRIADNDGTGNGTPVNQYTNDDIHQFLAKLLRRTGIPSNGFPENEYSGHQYHQALDAIIKAVISVPDAWTTIPLINGWAVANGATPKFRVSRTGRVEFMGQLDATGATNSTFAASGTIPAGLRGSYNRQLTGFRIRVSTFVQEVCSLSIQTNGSLVLNDYSNSVTAFIDGLSYTVDV